MKDFVNELTKLRNAIPGVRTIVEHSPVRESQSNGFIEAGVKTVGGIVRTMKLNLEHRLHECIEVDHPIFYWLVEHAADVSTKFQKGVDGKTAYERLKDKPYRGEILEFGCQVHHRVPGKTQGGLLAARWHTGVWLGKRFASDEHLVSMPDGTVVRARSVQAFPVEQLWSKEAVDRVKGMPWAPTSTLTQNTYLRPSIPAPAEGADDERHWIPRGPPVRPRHLEKFGFSSNCRKCIHIRTGDGSQPTLGHSQTCRKRIFAEVAKHPDMRCKVEAHGSRNMKYFEGAVEQEDQRMRDAKVVEQSQSAPTQDATMASLSSSSSSSSASSSSSSQAGGEKGGPAQLALGERAEEFLS